MNRIFKSIIPFGMILLITSTAIFANDLGFDSDQSSTNNAALDGDFAQNDDTYFSDEEIRKIAEYHTSGYLEGKIRDEAVSVSDDWVPLHNTNSELVAYMIPLVNDAGNVEGHINVGAYRDGYSFYSIEEKDESYTKASELKNDGNEIIFLPPGGYAVEYENELYSLDNEIIEFNIADDKSRSIDSSEELLQNLYSNMRSSENEILNEKLLNETSALRAVRSEDVRLSDEEDFMDIDGEYYGGDQNWFSSSYQRNRGCGPTAAANITAYMSIHQGSWAEDLYSYSKSDITESDFTDHMNEVIEYVTPTIAGMPSYTSWGSDVEDFADSRDVDLRAFYSSLSPTLENASNYVKDGLENDSPVGLLMYYNPNLPEYDWHWMTITKYFRDTADNRYIAVSTWGERRSLNWNWVWENGLYEAILYFV